MNPGPIKTGDLVQIYAAHDRSLITPKHDYHDQWGHVIGWSIDWMAGTVEVIVNLADRWTIFSAHWDEDLHCYVYFPSQYDGMVEWRMLIRGED